MGIDLKDFDEEHLIFKTTVIILPDEAVVERQRTRFICDVIKRIVYDKPGTGFIYANTTRISAFKSDLLDYIVQHVDTTVFDKKEKIREQEKNLYPYKYMKLIPVERASDRIGKFSKDVNASLLCCVALSHDQYDDRHEHRLYLTEDEKRNLSSIPKIGWVPLDYLLDEQVSASAVNTALRGLFDSGIASVSDEKSRARKWMAIFDYMHLKPTMFGVGVDLNKVINALQGRTPKGES